MTRRWWAPAALALLVASAAHADPARARARFEAGLQLLDAGQHARALEEFRAAYALWKNPKILLNIGTTLRALGRDAEAANAYARYLRAPDADPSRAVEVQAVLAEIDARVGRLELRIDDPTAEVLVDGTVPSEWQPDEPLRVAPGPHSVVARAQGSRRAASELQISAGEQRRVDLELRASVQAEAVPRDVAAPPAEQDRGADPQPPGLSHADQLGAFVRADIDGLGRGVVVAPGVSFGVGHHLDVLAAGLIGRDKGVWVGAKLFALQTSLKPSLLLGAPIFAVAGARVGLQASLGLQWDVSRHFGSFVDLGVVHFLSPPEGYEKTTFLPSAGIQTRL